MIPELNEKTQYKFIDESADDDDVSLSDPAIARVVFDALFRDPPVYALASDKASAAHCAAVSRDNQPKPTRAAVTC